MMADLLVYLLRFKEGDRRHRNLLKMYTIYIYIFKSNLIFQSGNYYGKSQRIEYCS